MFRVTSRHFGLSVIVAVAAAVVLTGCGRNKLSPVEIKIDGGEVQPVRIEDSASISSVTVGEHETLSDIAYRYNIDPDSLAKTNGIKPPYRIREGQVLKFPTASDSPSSGDKLIIEEDGGGRDPESDAKNRRKKKLDDEFAGVLSAGGGVRSAKSKEQEKLLSSPKITETAGGKAVASAAAKNGKTSAGAAKKSGKMLFPVGSGKIISRYGDVKDGISNDGVDIKAAAGAPVRAVADGEVIYAGNKLEDFGNTVIIRHGDGLITSYAHLGEMKVKAGAEVGAGDVIGSVGKTGDVKEPQLHFEVLKNKAPTDPEKYLAKREKGK